MKKLMLGLGICCAVLGLNSITLAATQLDNQGTQDQITASAASPAPTDEQASNDASSVNPDNAQQASADDQYEGDDSQASNDVDQDPNQQQYADATNQPKSAASELNQKEPNEPAAGADEN